MKLTFAVLLLALPLAAGTSVLAASQVISLDIGRSQAFNAASGAELTLIDADDDDDDEGGWLWSGSKDDDCEDDGVEQEDDGCTTGAGNNSTKAGTIAPPKNGLFTDGTAPVVKSN